MSDSITWKPVVGYEGIYEVSNTGLVKRVKKPGKGASTHVGKLLKGCTNRDGYQRMYLHKDGKDRAIFLHRIVAAAFIGELPEDCEVNHRDGNRKNNHVDNLEYTTHGDNVRYAFHVLDYRPVGMPGERNGQAKITNEQAREIKRLLAEGKLTQPQIADIFGVSRGIVTKINVGQTWKHLDAA